MGSIFDLDGKFMHFANKFADLMWLNILTLVCCLPIFTIGASLTAMHYVTLRIYRNEESYISRDFFKSFRENFKQSTGLWLIFAAFILLLAADYWAIFKSGIEIHSFFKYALGFVGLLGVFTLSWVFVLQSRYRNTIRGTIKNAIVVGTSHFAYSIMMLLLAAIPVLLLYLFTMAVPFVFLFGFTVPALLQCMLYSRVFDRMEGIDRKAEAQKPDDGWTVELEEQEQTENVGQNNEINE